jgi:hypothetical protein
VVRVFRDQETDAGGKVFRLIAPPGKGRFVRITIALYYEAERRCAKSRCSFREAQAPPWSFIGLCRVTNIEKFQRGIGKEEAPVRSSLGGVIVRVPPVRPKSVRSPASGTDSSDSMKKWSSCIRPVF